MTTKIVTYLRVSTVKQGQSGLGLEAQRAAVLSYLNGGDWTIIRECVEVESGKNNDRAELARALRLCRLHKAKLVIAKLDRLSRDAHFLLGLEKAGVDFVCADMPSANRLTVGIMAMVAEEERRMISARTKAALQAAKARGVRLGGDRGGRGSAEGRTAAVEAARAAASDRADDVMPLIAELQSDGIVSLSGIARALREREIPKARGGLSWTATDVRNLLARNQQA